LVLALKNLLAPPRYRLLRMFKPAFQQVGVLAVFLPSAQRRHDSCTA